MQQTRALDPTNPQALNANTRAAVCASVVLVSAGAALPS
jgi:hypothetical protein